MIYVRCSGEEIDYEEGERRVSRMAQTPVKYFAQMLTV